MKVFVDCWTSGNPGPGGYQVIDEYGRVLDYENYEGHHSNNYYELTAILAGLKQISATGGLVYSDSRIAIGWVRNGIKKSAMNREEVENIILSIRKLLSPKHGLKYWDTRKNGENPADFGRKHTSRSYADAPYWSSW